LLIIVHSCQSSSVGCQSVSVALSVSCRRLVSQSLSPCWSLSAHWSVVVTSSVIVGLSSSCRSVVITSSVSHRLLVGQLLSVIISSSVSCCQLVSWLLSPHRSVIVSSSAVIVSSSVVVSLSASRWSVIVSQSSFDSLLSVSCHSSLSIIGRCRPLSVCCQSVVGQLSGVVVLYCTCIIQAQFHTLSHHSCMWRPP